jgi:ABC-type transporter Mla subunit MlaD
MPPDQTDPSGSKSEQGQRSLNQTIDQANRAIEGSRAEIARSHALGQSVADLTRKLERISDDENDASQALKDEA